MFEKLEGAAVLEATDEEKARAFEWLRGVAISKAPTARHAAVALCEWHDMRALSTRTHSLRHLQEHLPWTLKYTYEFEASSGSNPQRRIGHDVLHVLKSLGKIASDVEAADHGRMRKLEGPTLAKEVADLVICALHIAKLEGFDLQEAVVSSSELRNGVAIPVERRSAD